jgi:hypothetical protein
LDLEKAKEIHSSQIWTEVCGELDLWIRSEEIKLRSCVPEQLPKIQKVIETLERVKDLPRVVIEREE